MPFFFILSVTTLNSYSSKYIYNRIEQITGHARVRTHSHKQTNKKNISKCWILFHPVLVSNFTSRPKHLNAVPGTNWTVATLGPWQRGLVLRLRHPFVHAFGFSTGWRDSSSRPPRHSSTTPLFPRMARANFIWFPPGEIEHSNKMAKLVVKLIGLADARKKEKEKKTTILIDNISLSDVTWRELSSVFSTQVCCPHTGGWSVAFFFFRCHSATLCWKVTG